MNMRYATNTNVYLNDKLYTIYLEMIVSLRSLYTTFLRKTTETTIIISDKKYFSRRIILLQFSQRKLKRKKTSIKIKFS